MPKHLWALKMEDALACALDLYGRREGRRKERAWALQKGAWCCWLKYPKTLGKALLNRHKVWILLKIKLQLNTSSTCIRNLYSFSYLTPFRRFFRCQLLEPLHPQNHTPFCIQGMHHIGSTSPLMVGYAQLDQIKWRPIKTIKKIN